MLLQLGGKEIPFEFFEEKNSTSLSFASYGLTENQFPFLKHQKLSRVNNQRNAGNTRVVYLLNLLLGKDFDVAGLHKN
jgi:hypothetical protein